DSISLDVSQVCTDAAQFETHIRGASQGDPLDRARGLEKALSVYRGPLLTGFYQECFGTAQRHFAQMYLDAIHALPRHYESGGDIRRGIDAARRAVQIDPLMEEMHCCLMRLYAKAGQPSAVMR